MNYSPTTKDEAQIRAIADRMLGAYGEAHARMTEVRNVVRYRLIEELKRLKSQGITPAYSSRPLAIAHQARAFLDDSIIKYEVLDHDNSIKENRITTPLEKWLSGIKPTYAEMGLFPFADWIYDYFEVGTGVLKLRFDFGRAAMGEFPFVLEAVDPTNWACMQGTKGLVWAVERECKDAAVLCDELDTQLSGVKEANWKIPEWLKQMGKESPDASVEFMSVYSRDTCWTFVNALTSDEEEARAGQLLYKYEHYMGRVPFLPAYCTAIHSNRPEEKGFGMVYPILSMLKQENILFSKFASDAEIGSRPLATYVDDMGHQIVEQIYSGWKSERPIRAGTFEPMNLTQNNEMMDRLLTVAQNDINRMSFPEITYGGDIIAQSGEAWRNVLSGVGAKIRQYGNQPQSVLGILAGWMLERVEYFMTPAMAREFAPKHVDDYMDSCSVGLGTRSSVGKEKGLLALTAKDVKGHYRVRVTLEPNLPQDDTAKVDRFTRVMAIEGFPFEQALRTYLQPEHPEEFIEAYWENILMAELPEYKEVKLRRAFIERMEQDPKLAEELQALLTEKEATETEQAAQQGAAQQPMMQDPMAQQGMPPQDPMALLQQLPPQVLQMLMASGQIPPQLMAGSQQQTPPLLTAQV